MATGGAIRLEGENAAAAAGWVAAQPQVSLVVLRVAIAWLGRAEPFFLNLRLINSPSIGQSE